MILKLGDICSFQTGGTPPKGEPEYFDGGIPWITTVALNGRHVNEQDAVNWITERAIEETSAKIVPAKSIMIGVRVGVGKVAINDVNISTSQDVVSLLGINEARWNKDYLCKYLQSKSAYLNSQARGATIKGIKIETLAELDVPTIALNQQNQIVQVLDQVAAIKAARQKQLDALDELVKARFIEMFGDEGNPQKWDVVQVEDIAKVQVGIVIKPSQYYSNSDQGVKAFRSLNIGEMFIKDNDWVYFSEQGNCANKKTILKENDLLIVRSGAPGTSCVVTKDYEGCNAIDIIIARPIIEKINPYYLCVYTNMPHGKNQILQGTSGAAQQHFNIGKYNKLKITLPPKKMQDKYAAFIAQVDKTRKTIRESLTETETLFQSLMQEYFG